MKTQYGIILEDTPEELLASLQEAGKEGYVACGGLTIYNGKVVILVSRYIDIEEEKEE